MKRKIIFAVTNDLSYDQRMIRICQTLTADEFEVLLVGRQKKQSIPLPSHTFQQKRLQLWFSKGKLFYIEYQIRLFFFLLKQQVDIIGAIDLDTLLPCFLVAKLRGKKCVFDAHEYFTEVPEVVNRPFTKLVWSQVGNRIIPKLEYAYTVSQSLQNLFTQKYGIPFQLIRNMASLNKEKFHESERQETILLYQGVLNKGRGIEILIEIMSQLTSVQLWLAGEGDLSQKLRSKVAQLDLQEKVFFLGYLSPERLKETTQKADIGLNLLENLGLSYYYSLANKTFDYMHANLPAIHSSFPEYQIINREFEIGVLVENLEKETIIKAINQLILDKAYYRRLKQNCQKAKKKYNWQNESIQLLNFYRNIS